MTNLTKKSYNILKSFNEKRNITSVSNKFNMSYDIIRNNYFKPYVRQGYIQRISYGHYILSEKGKDKIKKWEIFQKINKDIPQIVKKGLSNAQIIELFNKKYSVTLSNSSLYTKISRLRKTFNFVDRRKVIGDIPTKISKEFAELLGLLFSDGYLSKYEFSFYNTNETLIKKFQELTLKVFKLELRSKIRKMSSGASGIFYYSINVSNFLNKMTSNKAKIPDEIIKTNKFIKNAFLRGYFSGDGAICLTITYKKAKKKFELAPHVYLACRRIDITNALETILCSLDYKPRKSSTGLRLGRKVDIIRFNREIGFIKGCKITSHSNSWRGFEKNKLLKFIIMSLNDKALLSLLKSAKKEEIIRFIQNKLEMLT